MKKNGFVKLKKCEFFKNEVSFLGHRVSGGGICVEEDKINVIKEWPIPKTVRDNRWEYCVRWKGYGPEDDTYQTLKDLNNVSHLVKEYEDSLNSIQQERSKQSSNPNQNPNSDLTNLEQSRNVTTVSNEEDLSKALVCNLIE